MGVGSPGLGAGVLRVQDLEVSELGATGFRVCRLEISIKGLGSVSFQKTKSSNQTYEGSGLGCRVKRLACSQGLAPSGCRHIIERNAGVCMGLWQDSLQNNSWPCERRSPHVHIQRSGA